MESKIKSTFYGFTTPQKTSFFICKISPDYDRQLLFQWGAISCAFLLSVNLFPIWSLLLSFSPISLYYTITGSHQKHPLNPFLSFTKVYKRSACSWMWASSFWSLIDDSWTTLKLLQRVLFTAGRIWLSWILNIGKPERPKVQKGSILVLYIHQFLWFGRICYHFSTISWFGLDIAGTVPLSHCCHLMVKSPISRMVKRSGLFYPTIGFVSLVTFIYMCFGDLWVDVHKETKLNFVERNGTQFFVDGRAFYVNGWNSYWLMDHAVDGSRRPRIRAMLQAGAKMGLTVCRTWAFNDGAHNALQLSPGRFDERVFRVRIFAFQ